MGIFESNTGILSSQNKSRRLLKNHQSVVALLQLLIDIGTSCILLYVLSVNKLGDFAPEYRVLAVLISLFIWVIYSWRGVYRQSRGYLTGSMRVASSWMLLVLSLTLVGFVTKTSEIFSREILLSWAVLTLLFHNFSYWIIRYVAMQSRGVAGRVYKALVIGTGSTAQHLAGNLNKNPWLPDHVVGCVRTREGEENDSRLQVGIVGGLENLSSLITEHDIKRVYIALPIETSHLIESIHLDLMDRNVDVIWAPDIYAINLLNHSVREVAGIPLISLNESPLTSSRVAMVLKALMDRVVALLALLVFSPLLIWVAIKIKLSSPGPVFFKQDRHGWNGQIIKVWKFRSMKLHEEQKGVVTQATKDDDRITDIGRLIRRTSIDELPQLINVLQGTMSLVGPRPHALAHNDYYSTKINAYLSRHRIKPGMTGLAQINGCRGETETIDKMEQRLEYDVAYINNWSLYLDVKILLKTPFTLISEDIY